MSGHLDNAEDEAAIVEEARKFAQANGATYGMFSGFSGSHNLLEGGIMSEGMEEGQEGAGTGGGSGTENNPNEPTPEAPTPQEETPGDNAEEASA